MIVLLSPMGPSSRRTILNNTHLTAEPFKFSPAEPVDYGKDVYGSHVCIIVRDGFGDNVFTTWMV
jgi:hypothetical protein